MCLLQRALENRDDGHLRLETLTVIPPGLRRREWQVRRVKLLQRAPLVVRWEI